MYATLRACPRGAPRVGGLRKQYGLRTKVDVKGLFAPRDTFERRHIGPRESDLASMLSTVGAPDLESFVSSIVPAGIRRPKGSMDVGRPYGENEALSVLKAIAKKNRTDIRSFIGMGYYPTITPTVILRNLLENPGWYTPYTPYQAEISQGRLDSLLNYQTLIQDLTGLDVSNASLLDEGTAAAEAMSMAASHHRRKRHTFFVSHLVHPQTLGVIETRAAPFGFKIVVGDVSKFDFKSIKDDLFGVLFQYPGTDGSIQSYNQIVKNVQETGAVTVCATDLMALTLIQSPKEVGFDIAVGNSQRFGVQVAYGGPHAGFIAVKDAYKRLLPGRIIGTSIDVTGKRAIRMALQAREQHIRREKATSNICTAQALLANIAAMYAVYHGPKGLKEIATVIHQKTLLLSEALKTVGYNLSSDPFFDTVRINTGNESDAVTAHLLKHGFNIRNGRDYVSVTLDEPTTEAEVQALVNAFASYKSQKAPALDALHLNENLNAFARQTEYLQHKVFNTYHSETEMMRYLYHLQKKDLGLTTAAIPLGSCTLKLNSATEMIPVTWPEFATLHPFVPLDQAQGYQEMIRQVEDALSTITGFAAVSLQPNAGSQGEYAGLNCIRSYFIAKGEPHRNVCLIPASAHGTNPATAAMVSMQVVQVDSDANGNICIEDLKKKVEQHKDTLACIMATYPSTHGIFEEAIQEVCELVHKAGGQVYMDGANMNAQCGLTSPGHIGADVCHLNLHKTFSIPHGGGGPGIGPVCVAKHLVPFLPNNKVIKFNPSDKSLGAVSSAPWGSANVLPITWAYIKMMGEEGLTKASTIAMLNANYMQKRLEPHYKILYKGRNGYVAHEFILDLREFGTIGITEQDVAKRLIDFGFHPPTMSWPVVGTLMFEPTESESKVELDRLIDALIHIRGEIRDVEQGKYTAEESVLHHAPHPLEVIISDKWDRKYTREQAAYPVPGLRENKHWPTCSRVDNVHGDRNLCTSCGTN